MSEARVLAYTPTYDDLLRPETVTAMEAMAFDGVLDWHVSKENPYPGRDMRNVWHQYMKGRQMALDGGYDGLLCVEHDMVPPPDGAQKLWDTEQPNGQPAQVVYGSYQFRHGMRVLNLFQKCSAVGLGMSLSLYPREVKAARAAKAWEVSGSGMGFLLIRRDTLAAIPFRKTGNPPDLPFAVECLNRKIVQMGRLDVDCGHYDEEYDCILYAFEQGGIIARVLALHNVTVRLEDGRSLPMLAGRYYSMAVTDAREHARAGHLQITNEALEVTEELGIEVDGPEPAPEQVRETATAPETKTKRKPRARKATAKKTTTRKKATSK